jgi:hypothetical protein
MTFLNSFIHGEAMTEILIEGHHPQARQKLTSTQADALRQHVRVGDELKAYVIGRVVMSGRGVWAVTGANVLLLNESLQGVNTLPLGSVDRFEAVRGRYGHTVRLHVQGRCHSLYGVDKDLAQTLHQAMVAQGVLSSFEDKPARGTLWSAYSGPLPSAQDCLADARQRLVAA